MPQAKKPGSSGSRKRSGRDASTALTPVPTSPDEVAANIAILRDRLLSSLTLTTERLQDTVDDAVRRGRITRGDAEEMVGRLITRGRDQAEDLMAQLERVISQFREAPGRARQEVSGRTMEARKRAVKAVDKPLAGADRMRRAARIPGFPITAYDQLSIRQIDRRLQELSRAELRRVREAAAT